MYDLRLLITLENLARKLFFKSSSKVLLVSTYLNLPRKTRVGRYKHERFSVTELSFLLVFQLRQTYNLRIVLIINFVLINSKTFSRTEVYESRRLSPNKTFYGVIDVSFNTDKVITISKV